jgi:hypothetical protein
VVSAFRGDGRCSTANKGIVLRNERARDDRHSRHRACNCLFIRGQGDVKTENSRRRLAYHCALFSTASATFFGCTLSQKPRIRISS